MSFANKVGESIRGVQEIILREAVQISVKTAIEREDLNDPNNPGFSVIMDLVRRNNEPNKDFSRKLRVIVGELRNIIKSDRIPGTALSLSPAHKEMLEGVIDMARGADAYRSPSRM